jgi:hypothetical protein
MSACTRCGLPALPGQLWCAACIALQALRLSPRIEPRPCSEELSAACMGRLAKLEEDVASLRRLCSGLTGQVADLLRRAEEEHDG